MQWQGSDLTLLVYPLRVFFSLFFLVDLQESLCLVIVFPVTTIASQGCSQNYVLRKTLYPDIILTDVPPGKILHIHLAAHYRSYADDFVICGPPRVDCESDAVALLSAEIGHKMS